MIPYFKKMLSLALLACALPAAAQYRTYRVVDNGIETIGYCKLEQGQVVHKYTSAPEGGAAVTESENGSFTVQIPEHSNTEERFTVGPGVSFDQVFNAIHARYCVRQGYLNFQEAVKEKDKLAYQRMIKAIVAYYDNAIKALGSEERADAVQKIRELSRFTEEVPFMRGKPAKGYLPEYVRRVENAMKSILVYDPEVDPGYSVVVHKSPVEPAKPKKKRR